MPCRLPLHLEISDGYTTIFFTEGLLYVLETTRCHCACWLHKASSSHRCWKWSLVEGRISGQQRAMLFHREFLTTLTARARPANSSKWKNSKKLANPKFTKSRPDVRYNHTWHNKWEKLFHSPNVPVLTFAGFQELLPVTTAHWLL